MRKETKPFSWSMKKEDYPKEIQDWCDEEKEKFAEEVYLILLTG